MKGSDFRGLGGFGGQGSGFRFQNSAVRRPAGLPRGKTRGGYTLVEALVVISINSILMAVALTLLGLLLKSERHGRRHYERTRSVLRLANDLRDVAAIADHAENDMGEAGLRLRLPDEHAVEFTRDEDRIRRVELRGAAVVRREAYPIDGLKGAKFLVSAEKFISLELNVDGENAGPWRIDARLAGARLDASPP